MSQVKTYLSRKDYDRLSKICEIEGCTPYTLAKIALLDKIHNYNLKEKGPGQSGENGEKDIPGTKTDVAAKDVAETVKKLINK